MLIGVLKYLIFTGLAAKIYDRTRTMTDVYNAFFEFASVMKSKVVFIGNKKNSNVIVLFNVFTLQ